MLPYWDCISHNLNYAPMLLTTPVATAKTLNPKHMMLELVTDLFGADLRILAYKEAHSERFLENRLTKHFKFFTVNLKYFQFLFSKLLSNRQCLPHDLLSLWPAFQTLRFIKCCRIGQSNQVLNLWMPEESIQLTASEVIKKTFGQKISGNRGAGLALGQGSRGHRGHKATGQALTPGLQPRDTQPAKLHRTGPRPELAAAPK